ncbi:Hypothetical predicted protein [Mytilus galloprovincialis]|uniref:Uncharacterized protein n=1 Tax=Mytilus galloprovincialis TaxID=29158 RepID=A0A8B6FRT5_MYTGA|nr:Hypothetical predicted protein [Mytilus galloprovincialis]
MHKPSVNMHTGNIKIVHVFNVAERTSGTSFGSGLFLGNFILLTNHLYSRVVKFNRDFVYQSELKLPNRPFDITKIDDSKVAVGAQPQIFIISVKNMQIEKTLTINNSFWGLQYVCPEFIVAYCGKLTWIDDSSGSRIRDFQTGHECYYLHAFGRNYYTCAVTPNSVCKYVNGKDEFTYNSKELNGIRGIDEDCEGNIYICGYMSKNIHQLTKEGILVREFSTASFGISRPWIIRFESNSNTFLLTDMDSGKVVIGKVC